MIRIFGDHSQGDLGVSSRMRLTVESVLVILCGYVVVVLIWVLSLGGQRLPFSFDGLSTIHRVHGALWVVDFFPLLNGLVWYFALRRQRERMWDSESRLRSNEALMSRISEFALAIGEGNYDATFSQSDGEAPLGRSIVQMRDNLRRNSEIEAQNDWIARGKEQVGDELRKHTDVRGLAYAILRSLSDYIQVEQGALFLLDSAPEAEDGIGVEVLRCVSMYAYGRDKLNRSEFRVGEGLVGQCAYERAVIHRTEVPEEYVSVHSGILGSRRPRSLLLVPLLMDGELQGVLEFASIRSEFGSREIRFLEEMGETIARTFFNLRVTTRTQELYEESKNMTEELQRNQKKLSENAVKMDEAHRKLERSNRELNAKMVEAENAQKRLNALLANASELIMIYNRDLEITYISPSVSSILGYSEQEMMEGKAQERISQTDSERMYDMFQHLLMSNSLLPLKVEYEFLHKDGRKIFMEASGRNMLNDSSIEGIILNSRDVTERVRAKREEDMRSQMQNLSENSLDMIIRMDTGGTFFYVNPAASEYLGVSVDDLIMSRLGELDLPVVLSEALSEALRSLIEDQASRWEKEVILGDGAEARTLQLTGIPEFSGVLLQSILLIGHDVTEAKRIEFEIQDKSRKITESINYAQRIQSSILPNTELIQYYFPSSFIFYRPRDVVSGDFPWFFRKDDYLYVAAVDCTGHGVPGAMLSFIGFFTLNNIVDHDSGYSAGEVLDELHKGVRKTLRQEHADADARDGMDIALCKIDVRGGELQYSGAHRPLYFLRGDDLTEYRGDRRAIGGIPHPRRADGDFTNYTIPIERGDRIFIFSDGLPDQLGGARGLKKFSPQRIRDIIVSGRDVRMKALSERFESEFDGHMGETKQIDDVLLIGIEF